MNSGTWIPTLIISEFFFVMACGQHDTLVLSSINNHALSKKSKEQFESTHQPEGIGLTQSRLALDIYGVD